MEWLSFGVLVLFGLLGGYIAGLIGIGGGLIFAPVLFFYFQQTGVDAAIIAPLTLGSSLLCTLIASLASAWFQDRKGAVLRRIAVFVGLFSGVAVWLTTRYVTTQAWYDAETFQVVFGLLLLLVVVRMVRKAAPASAQEPDPEPVTARWPRLAAIGSGAGMISAAAGIGGGIVLVPAYSTLLRQPIRRSVGTSSATIVLVSLMGVLSYAMLGWGSAVPATALGYVDVGRALLLALPATLTARAGVWTAHRIDTRKLRLSFAALAAVVAVRLLLSAVGVV